MRALAIATTAPDGASANQTGSTNWTLRLCKTLNCQHDVTLITPPPIEEPWIHSSGITLLCHDVDKGGSRLSRLFKSFFYGIYPSIWTLYSSQTSLFLRELTEGSFDVCWLLDDYAGIYLRDLPTFLPAIFVRHYLLSMQETFHKGNPELIGYAKSFYHKRTALAFDKWTTLRAAVVTLGTQESAAFLKREFPSSSIEYLPTKPSTLPQPSPPEKIEHPLRQDKRLVALYLADMSFIRNAEGAQWFIEKTLPRIPVEVRQQYHFQFVGRRPEPLPDIHNLPEGTSVEFTGFVDDLTETLHSAQVAFIPVFGGNGIRLKTLTLLGTGLPTISTKDALEGLEIVDGQDVFIANTPEGFADSFQKMLRPRVRLSMHKNSLRYMKKFLGEEEDAQLLFSLSKAALGKT